MNLMPDEITAEQERWDTLMSRVCNPDAVVTQAQRQLRAWQQHVNISLRSVVHKAVCKW